MNSIEKFMHEAASAIGLRVDAHTGAIFGNCSGYLMTISSINQGYSLQISVSVCKGGTAPLIADVKQATKEIKGLTGGTIQRYKINYLVRGSRGKVLVAISEALPQLCSFLHRHGYENCCQQCGTIGQTESYVLMGFSSMLCGSCFTAMSNAAEQKQQAENRKPENVVGGIVGTFLGSILGAAVIVLLGQIGYVAALSGMVMAICTLTGYQLLGGLLSNKGIVISSVVMLCMTWLGYLVDWAITIANYFSVNVFVAFRSITGLIQEGYIEASAFYGGLAILYVFVLLGAVPMVIQTVKGRKFTVITGKMSPTEETSLLQG